MCASESILALPDVVRLRYEVDNDRHTKLLLTASQDCGLDIDSSNLELELIDSSGPTRTPSTFAVREKHLFSRFEIFQGRLASRLQPRRRIVDFVTRVLDIVIEVAVMPLGISIPTLGLKKTIQALDGNFIATDSPQMATHPIVTEVKPFIPPILPFVYIGNPWVCNVRIVAVVALADVLALSLALADVLALSLALALADVRALALRKTIYRRRIDLWNFSTSVIDLSLKGAYDGRAVTSVHP